MDPVRAKGGANRKLAAPLGHAVRERAEQADTPLQRRARRALSHARHQA
jgi:hypothetical protein